MAVAGFYRRSLPSPPAVDFSSPPGKKLFREALQNGNMEGFFNLISHFQTQSEPAYCGLATLAMILNALGIDPCRKWKGPWRWFDETMLDCCEPLDKVKAKGISFGKVICLGHCAGAKVESFRTNQSSIHEFRKYVVACSTSENCHIIASYTRRAFKQTGTGHFSPIGGYHAERDMVLILDVARFKYPPHWVPLTLLWEAMDSTDEATGRKRGNQKEAMHAEANIYIIGLLERIASFSLLSQSLSLRFMLVSRRQREPALLPALSCKDDGWISTAKYLTDEVPLLLSSHNIKGVKDIISTVFSSSLPPDFTEFIKWVAEVRFIKDGGLPLSDREKVRLEFKRKVLKQVQDTSLYKHVTGALSSENPTKMIYTSDENDAHATKISRAEANSIGGMGAEANSIGSKSHCHSGMHPASNDVLTALLFAIPPETWRAVKDEQVLEEISSLVSIQRLPPLLQDEVLHLRDQLFVLKRCNNGCVEHDIDALVI